MNVEPKFIIGEINAQLLQDFFAREADPESIRYRGHREYLISSPGGDIGYMLAMFDQIRLSEASTIAAGVLQSAAAVLLQAGKVRKMTRNGLLLFHEPEKKKFVANPGAETEQVEEKIPDLEWTLYTHIVGLVADRTGMSKIEAYDLFDGRFINAERAKNLNLIDEIIELPVIPVYHENENLVVSIPETPDYDMGSAMQRSLRLALFNDDCKSDI